MKTQNLGLRLPEMNTTGWGETINNNFTQLDQAYHSLNMLVSGLKDQLGGLGFYNYNDAYPYLIITTSSVYMQSDDSTKIEKIELWNSVDGFTTAFDDLLAWTYFEVKATTNIEWNGVIWNTGNLAVKVVRYTNNGINSYISKLPQTLGGFYKLTQYINDNNVPKGVYVKVDTIDKEQTTYSPVLYPKITSSRSNKLYFSLVSEDPNNIIIQDAFSYSYPTVMQQSKTVSPTQYPDSGQWIYATDMDIDKYIIANIDYTYNKDNLSTEIGSNIILGYTIEKQNNKYVIVTDVSYLSNEFFSTRLAMTITYYLKQNPQYGTIVTANNQVQNTWDIDPMLSDVASLKKDKADLTLVEPMTSDIDMLKKNKADLTLVEPMASDIDALKKDKANLTLVEPMASDIDALKKDKADLTLVNNVISAVSLLQAQQHRIYKHHLELKTGDTSFSIDIITTNDQKCMIQNKHLLFSNEHYILNCYNKAPNHREVFMFDWDTVNNQWLLKYLTPTGLEIKSLPSDSGKDYIYTITAIQPS